MGVQHSDLGASRHDLHRVRLLWRVFAYESYLRAAAPNGGNQLSGLRAVVAGL